MVCLSCTATGERVCLAAEGFGNRHCFLENIADKNIPPDLSQCVFVIEQALSVRALQELVTAAASESVSLNILRLSLSLSHANMINLKNFKLVKEKTRTMINFKQ
jgi:Inositol 1,4,5-trisphosphate/ryanodine receptor